MLNFKFNWMFTIWVGYFNSVKELSLCHKLRTSTTYIFAIRLCKPLIFQTMIIWSNTIHSLKYQRFTTLGCKDKGIRISEFVAKTQILCMGPSVSSVSAVFSPFLLIYATDKSKISIVRYRIQFEYCLVKIHKEI